MFLLLDLGYLAVLLLLSPWLIFKALTAGKYRRGLGAKLTGAAFVRTSSRPCAWFHAVSVGEVHLLRPVIAAFRRRNPQWECVISTTTDTGFEEATRRFADLRVFFWPFDFSWAVRRALESVNPTMIVLAEGEIWPNFLRAAQRRAVPVAVVNARMSPRSFHRYRVLGALSRLVLGWIERFLVQTEDYARCYELLGVPAKRLVVTGSVKFDGAEMERDNPRTAELRRLLGIQASDLVWVAGSTQAPEEAIALEIYRELRLRHPTLRLILVPRQRERFEEVAGLLRRSGEPFVRRTELAVPAVDRPPIILVDTIGELGAVWGLADVAFVGGSMDGKRGGQNMIEPAAYGAAVVFGPHVWNFRTIAAQLVQAEAALQITDRASLAAAVSRFLDELTLRRQFGEAARQFVSEQQGASERTAAALTTLAVEAETRAMRRAAAAA